MEQGGPRLRGVDAEELQDLVLESVDVQEFLHMLSRYAAEYLSRTGRPVHCGVTVTRQRKPSMGAASDPEAVAMGKIPDLARDGPCMAAVRELRTIHVQDLGSERRWPKLSMAAADRGYRSIVAVPVEVDDQARAALIFYAEAPAAFTTDDITQAEIFARRASKALRLALRIGRLLEAREDLVAAMEARTVIDMAIGAIMAQNRCSPGKAFAFLRDASNTRNTKLRDVAKYVILSIDGTADVRAHFEE